MNLSRTTWHYKLYRYLRNFYEDGPIVPFRGNRCDYVPNSLCSYFWGVVLMTISLPIVIVLLAAFGIGVVVFAPIWYPLMRRSEKREEAYNAALDSWYEGKGPHPDDLNDLKKKHKRQSIGKTWFKAYKAKHCPLITLVD